MDIDIERLARAIAEGLKSGAFPKESGSAAGKEATLTLADMKVIAESIEKKAAGLGVRAVVALCDAGGNVRLCESMDDAFLASCEIATGKAYTSVALKMTTKELSSLAQPGKPLYGIQNVGSGRIVIFGGGEPLRHGGKILGGLGVSGGTEEQDTYLAAFGREVFEKRFGAF